MVYDDQLSTFEELLKKDGNITTHQQNIRSVAVEMFKVTNEVSSSFYQWYIPKKFRFVYSWHIGQHTIKPMRKLWVRNFKIPPFISDIFPRNSNLSTPDILANTPSNSTIYNYNNCRTRNYGLETLRYLVPNVYDKMPCS